MRVTKARRLGHFLGWLVVIEAPHGRLVARIEEVGQEYLIFVQCGGMDDGVRFRAPYDPDSTVRVFEEDERVLAFLEQSASGGAG